MKTLLFISASFLLFSCAGKQTAEETKTVIDSMTATTAKANDSITDIAVKTDSLKVTSVEKVEVKTEVPKTEKKETKPADKKKETIEADGTPKVIVDPGHAVPEVKGKTYRIKSFSIEKDILSIDITYRGGCGQNTFDLYSNGFLKKSLPPQVDVFLEHKKENETCSEEIKQTLKFDISSLKKSGYDLIVVNINNADNKLDWKIQ